MSESNRQNPIAAYHRILNLARSIGRTEIDLISDVEIEDNEIMKNIRVMSKNSFVFFWE
jgi:hypothetical protein